MLISIGPGPDDPGPDEVAGISITPPAVADEVGAVVVLLFTTRSTYESLTLVPGTGLVAPGWGTWALCKPMPETNDVIDDHPQWSSRRKILR